MKRAFESNSGRYRVDITVDGIDENRRVGVPVRCGVPLPKGIITDPTQAALFDELGRPIPFQPTVTGYWQDRTFKWLNLDFLAAAPRYTAVIGPKRQESITHPSISVSQDSEAITIITGPL